MNKEYLEAWNFIKDQMPNFTFSHLVTEMAKNTDIVDNALKRLESIDNATPSKALEELKRIDYNITYLLSDCDINEEVSMNFNSIRDNKSCEIIKQYILKAQEEHKLLEVIKEKVMNLVSISDGRVWDGELYQSNKLTEEETVILNRWKNE